MPRTITISIDEELMLKLLQRSFVFNEPINAMTNRLLKSALSMEPEFWV